MTTHRSSVTSSATLYDHYDTYYASGVGSREWRDLGALDKVANIESVWAATSEPTPHAVVELGCGEGAIGERLLDRAFCECYVGYDISTSGIQAAQSRQLDNAGFNHFDGAGTPDADQSYDLAVLSHVVEHVENPRSIIAEARRLARWVIIEVPLEYSRSTPDHFEWTDLGHINLYSPLLIRHLAESCGLAVIDEKVTVPSRAVLSDRRSRIRGGAEWAIKAGALWLGPSVAPHLFVYHGTLIGRSR